VTDKQTVKASEQCLAVEKVDYALQTGEIQAILVAPVVVVALFRKRLQAKTVGRGCIEIPSSKSAKGGPSASDKSSDVD
jgi:hypothetical protein